MTLYSSDMTYFSEYDSPLSEAPDPPTSGEERPSVQLLDPVQQVALRMKIILVAVSAIVAWISLAFLPGRLATSLATGAAGGSDSELAAAAASQAGNVAGVDLELSPLFTPEVLYWSDQIMSWAEAYGVAPNVVATIMQIESCGDPLAVSSAGARGLFQVMPFHFAAGEDSLDPDTNARRGLTYFAERLAQTRGDLGRAFAGYNGGHVAAGTSYDNWYPETQRYYVWSSGIMADLDGGVQRSPTLDEWLAAGGASLCRQAAARLGLS